MLGPGEGSGLLPWSWAESRLASSREYWIAMVRPDGRPHLGTGPDPTQITMLDATATYPLDSVSGLFTRGSSFVAHWLNSY